MNKTIKEIKERINMVNKQLNKVAEELDIELKDNLGEENIGISNDLFAKKEYLENQLEILTKSLNDLILTDVKMTESDVADALNVGKIAQIRVNDGREKEMKIVTPSEVDPANGFVSSESPIGKALLGQKAGDEVKIQTPVGVQKIKILYIISE